MLQISEIEKGSLADNLGLCVGDIVLTVNGNNIKDYIDWQYLTSDDFFVLGVKKKNGQTLKIEVVKGLQEKLGIIPKGIIYDQLKLCENNCIFCFVEQQAQALRKTLNLKDDDYRFSFLQGSYITLSNLTKKDFARIIELRLSPLNISVHTTNPQLRQKMMNNRKAGQIKEQLSFLAANQIQFNVQLVLCPGINDGEELNKSIKDLLSFYPALNSMGVVPVGVTKYREGLYPLSLYKKKNAKACLKLIRHWQEKIKRKFAKNILYAGDEFYFLAEENIPTYNHYHDFPQLENGIGLTRCLWQEFKDLKKKSLIIKKKNIALITSKLGAKALAPIIKELNKKNSLKLKLIVVENTFFGASVTVTGLLTGQDIVNCFKREEKLSKDIIIPRIALNEQGYFLDNYTMEKIEDEFPKVNFYQCHNLQEVLEVIENG